MPYEERFYRKQVQAKNLVHFELCLKETDLQIFAEKNLRDETIPLVRKYRSKIEKYIKKHPEFFISLKPLPIDEQADEIIKDMLKAGTAAGVGPMAGVAGAIAEYVGKDLLKFSKEVIVENGGDIFIATTTERTISIYAGSSPLSMKLGIKIPPHPDGYGICTSSGTVGESLSFGKADAVVVLSSSTTLADAAATAIGNRAKEESSINSAVEFAKSIDKIDGTVIIINDKLGVWGDVQLIKI